MNTQINILYRDAANYKTFSAPIVEGEISPAQEQIIKGCLMDGEFFVPEQVGLYDFERSQYGYDPDLDTAFCELCTTPFEITKDTPTESLTVETLVDNFLQAKGKWNPEYAPEPYGTEENFSIFCI